MLACRVAPVELLAGLHFLPVGWTVVRINPESAVSGVSLLVTPKNESASVPKEVHKHILA